MRLTFPTTRIAVTLMHRDTKLGLALAILVMGFAAALCFPRESGETPVDVTLQSESELDSQIRMLPVKPYTDADRPKPRITRTTPEPPESSDSAAVPEVLPLAGVQEPIPGIREPEPTPIEPGYLPAEVVVEPETPEEPVVHTRTYRVDYGDTLSGIAKKELGSHTKSHQLFEANRNQLSDPNDLVPGMVLVIPIPDGDEVTPAPGPEARTSVGDSTAVSSNPPGAVAPERPVATPKRASGLFKRPTRIGEGGSAVNPQ